MAGLEAPNEHQSEEDPLFHDQEFTAWWWDTHGFMEAEQRLIMARKVLRLCTSPECMMMMQLIISDLESLTTPRPLMDTVLGRLTAIAKVHPVFSGATAMCFGYILFSAGRAIMELVDRMQ